MPDPTTPLHPNCIRPPPQPPHVPSARRLTWCHLQHPAVPPSPRRVTDDTRLSQRSVSSPSYELLSITGCVLLLAPLGAGCVGPLGAGTPGCCLRGSPGCWVLSVLGPLSPGSVGPLSPGTPGCCLRGSPWSWVPSVLAPWHPWVLGPLSADSVGLLGAVYVGPLGPGSVGPLGAGCCCSWLLCIARCPVPAVHLLSRPGRCHRRDRLSRGRTRSRSGGRRVGK